MVIRKKEKNEGKFSLFPGGKNNPNVWKRTSIKFHKLGKGGEGSIKKMKEKKIKGGREVGE